MIQVIINNISVYVKSGDKIKATKKSIEITSAEGEYHFVPKLKGANQ